MPLVRDAIVGRRPARTVVRVAVLVVASAIVFRWVLIPIRTYGDSMLPAYSAGAFNVVNRAAYLWRPPARGDVVAIRLAGVHAVYVKRIVGMPGERVEIRVGTVFINDSPLDEPYLVNRGRWTLPEVMVPQDKYLVIGDNRNIPVEYHEFGLVERERIAGTLLW